VFVVLYNNVPCTLSGPPIAAILEVLGCGVHTGSTTPSPLDYTIDLNGSITQPLASTKMLRTTIIYCIYCPILKSTNSLFAVENAISVCDYAYADHPSLAKPAGRLTTPHTSRKR
jgi:hypothetical protein